MIKNLGYLEDTIEKAKSTTIRAYDDQEHVSQGIIALPIQVGPIIVDTTCQVLDLDLPYNILLGRPWIHALKFVALTYHQCVKFPFEGREITIHGDPEPFYYYKNLEEKFYKIPQIPKNDEGPIPSTSFVDP